MKRLVTIVVSLAALAPVAAHAQERMSDARYIAAQRCLAYAELPQLQSDPLDVSALREAADAGFRSQTVSSQTRDATRRVRVTANRIGVNEAGLTELRGYRDEACTGFVERGLVQHGGAARS